MATQETYRISEANCTTGEVIVRDMTEVEIEQLLADRAQAQIEREALQVVLDARATAKASAEAKLAALGLTAEEIAAL